MRRRIAFLLTLVMLFALCACGGHAEPEPTSTPEPTSEPTPEPTPQPTDMEICAEYAISELKDNLKNPSSLVVNHLYGVEAEEGYIYSIDYSAENSFGGSDRDTFFIHVNPIENGYSIKKYGSPDVASASNQSYTGQFFNQNSANGYYEFDADTYRISAVWNMN